MYCKFFKLSKHVVVLFMFTITSLSALSNNEQVQQCTAIKSNMKRLACFDDLFGTPVRSQEINVKSIDSVIPKTVSDIFALANAEDINEPNDELQIGLPSKEEGLAAIYIACKDNITRFQIVLKNPVSANPVNVEILDNATNRVVSKINWQNVERGYMLDGGRGLYAIQQLKSILYTDSFHIVIPQEKRSFTFDNNGLASRIAPIRQECGW